MSWLGNLMNAVNPAPKEYMESNNAAAGPIPVPAKQILPKDLLVHAKRFNREEAKVAIVAALKGAHGPPRNIPNSIWGSISTPSSIIYTTTDPSVWGTSTTIGTFTASAATTINGTHLAAGDSITYTANTSMNGGGGGNSGFTA